jgi:hypothetical protein
MGWVADWRPEFKSKIGRSLKNLTGAGSDKAPTPDTPIAPPPRVMPPKVVPKLVGPPPTPQVNPNCYQVSRVGAGFLTVASARAGRVEVDGLKVCGSPTKVPVTPGSHTVRVVDSKTGRESVSTLRFRAGKVVKLSPVFKSR